MDKKKILKALLKTFIVVIMISMFFITAIYFPYILLGIIALIGIIGLFCNYLYVGGITMLSKEEQKSIKVLE